MFLAHKIGLFGGSFNPIHKGHIESLKSVSKTFLLEKIHVLPALNHPFEKNLKSSTLEQRLTLIKAALKGLKKVHIDDREVTRGGVSYTVDTLKSFQKEFPDSELFWIMGVDQLENFHKWHRYEEILEITNFIVTSRGTNKIPSSLEELPEALQNQIKSFSKSKATLKSGKQMYWFSINEIPISSQKIRNKIKDGKNFCNDVEKEVYNLIEKEGIFKPKNQINSTHDLARICQKALREKIDSNIALFKFEPNKSIFDMALCVSGKNRKHTQALAEYLIKVIHKRTGITPLAIEGKREGEWVILDYETLVVHIFYEYVQKGLEISETWKSFGAKTISA